MEPRMEPDICDGKKRKRITRRRSKASADLDDTSSSEDEDLMKARSSHNSRRSSIQSSNSRLPDTKDDAVFDGKTDGDIEGQRTQELVKGNTGLDIVDEFDETPTSQDASVKNKEPLANGDHGDVQEPLEGIDDDAREDVGEEEEEDECMTSEERKAMYEAVKSGDIDLLEELLDKPWADINMIWFSENLLMTAIRAGQIEMSEFLIDNGTNINYETSRLQLVEKQDEETLECYSVSCRQMAYDRGLYSIVYLIDSINGTLFKGIKLAPRTPRLWRPKEERPAPSRSSSLSGSDGEEEADADAEMTLSPASSVHSLNDIADIGEQMMKKVVVAPVVNSIRARQTKSCETRPAGVTKPIVAPFSAPEPHRPAIVRSNTDLNTTSLSNCRSVTPPRRAKSALHYADTKSNMFRRRLNSGRRYDAVQIDVTPRVNLASAGSSRRSKLQIRSQSEYNDRSRNECSMQMTPEMPLHCNRVRLATRSAPAGRRVRSGRRVQWADESNEKMEISHSASQPGTDVLKFRSSSFLHENKLRRITTASIKQTERIDGERSCVVAATVYEPQAVQQFWTVLPHTAQTLLSVLPQIGKSVMRINSTLYASTVLRRT